jgi:hypothetical protein
MDLRREKMSEYDVAAEDSWEEPAIDPSQYNEEGELIGSATDHFNADLAAEAPAPDNTAAIQSDQDAKDAAAAQKLATEQQAQKELAAAKSPVTLAFVNSETGAAGLFEGTSPAQAAASPAQSAEVQTVAPEGAQQLDNEVGSQNKTATISAMQSPITGKVGLFAGASPQAELAEVSTKGFVKFEGFLGDIKRGWQESVDSSTGKAWGYMQAEVGQGLPKWAVPDATIRKAPDTAGALVGKTFGLVPQIMGILVKGYTNQVEAEQYAHKMGASNAELKDAGAKAYTLGAVETVALGIPGKLPVMGVLSKAPAPLAAALKASSNPLTRNFGGTLLSGTLQSGADTTNAALYKGEVKDAGQFAGRLGLGIAANLLFDVGGNALSKGLSDAKLGSGLFAPEASLQPAFASVNNGGGLFDPPATGASHSAIDPSKPMLSVTGNPGRDAELNAKGSASAAEGSAQSAAESATAARGSADTANQAADRAEIARSGTEVNAQNAANHADRVAQQMHQLEQKMAELRTHLDSNEAANPPTQAVLEVRAQFEQVNQRIAELEQGLTSDSGGRFDLSNPEFEANAKELEKLSDFRLRQNIEDLPVDFILSSQKRNVLADSAIASSGIKNMPNQTLLGADGVPIARIEKGYNTRRLQVDANGIPVTDPKTGRLKMGAEEDILYVNVAKLNGNPRDPNISAELQQQIKDAWFSTKGYNTLDGAQRSVVPGNIRAWVPSFKEVDSLYPGYNPAVKTHDFSKNRVKEYVGHDGQKHQLIATDTIIEGYRTSQGTRYKGLTPEQAFNQAAKDMPEEHVARKEIWADGAVVMKAEGLPLGEQNQIYANVPGDDPSVGSMGSAAGGSRPGALLMAQADSRHTGTNTIFNPNPHVAKKELEKRALDPTLFNQPGQDQLRNLLGIWNQNAALGLQRYTAGIQTIQVAGTLGTLAGVGIAGGNLLNNLKLGERSQTMVDPNDLSLIKAEAAMNLEKAKLSGPLGWVSHIPVLNGALAGVGVPFVTTPDNVKALENNLKVLKEVSAKSGYNYLYELQQIQKQQNELTSKERVAQNYNGKNVPMSFDEKRPFAERVASLLKAGDVGDYGIEYINQLKKLIGDEIAVYDKMMVSSQINRAAFGLGLFGDSPLGAQLLGALQTNLDQREKELFVGDPLKLLEYNLGVVDPNDKNPTKAKKSAIDHTLNVLRANFNDTNGGLEYYQDLLKKQSKEDLQRLIVSIVATSPGSSKPTASLQFMRNELGTQPIPNQYFTYENAIKASKDAATRNIGEWLSRQLALEATRGGQIASREDAAMGRAATLAGADHAAEVNREQGQANRDLSALTASNTQKLNAATAANSLQGTYRTGVTNWLARAFPNNRNASDIMINFQDQPLPIGDPTTGKLIYQPGAIRPVPLRIGHGAVYNDTVLTQIYNAARQTGYSGDYGQFKQQVVEQVRADRTKNNSGPVSQDEIKKPLPPMLQSDLPIPTANPAPAGTTGSDPLLMQTTP